MSQLISPLHGQSGTILTVDFSSVKLTVAQFERLCQDNPDLRLELTSTGELIVMPPAGSASGLRNCVLNQQLSNWVQIDGTGIAFDSSTGFTLPNGAVRSPDASWLQLSRWAALTEDEKEGFAPLCPDFAVELRSPSDSLTQLQNKMHEYIANGAKLAWLIDPLKRRVWVYRPDSEPEVMEDPETVSGEPVLPGFVLNPRELW